MIANGLIALTVYTRQNLSSFNPHNILWGRFSYYYQSLIDEDIKSQRG